MTFEKDSNWSMVKILTGGVLMMLMGAAATAWIYYSLFILQDEVAVQHDTWTQVPARVYECNVYKEGPRYRNQSSHEWVKVNYTYSVDGVRYDSDKLGVMDKDRIEMFREASGKSYIMSSTPADFLPPDLCCYVNPNNPNDAVLFADAESSPWWWITFLFGMWGGMTLAGVWLSVTSVIEICRRIGCFFRRLGSRRAE